MTVTAIRPVGRAQALEQLRLDPTLATISLTALAKRWGVSRSTVRGWLKAEAGSERPPSPLAIAMAHPPAPLPAALLGPPPAAPAPAAPALMTSAIAEPESDGRFANLSAYGVAAALASVAAYFSVSGMTEIFPGAPGPVVALAVTMEATKLVAAGWLARHWWHTGIILRLVLISLVAGLAAINAAGVYGRLVEAHVGVAVAAESSIDERLGALDARIDAQAQSVAALDQRLTEIDAAIGKLTERGRASAALNAIASQRTLRDALAVSRGKEEAALVDLRADRAKLAAERQRTEAAKGPVVYMAAMLGLPVELTVRWLILLMVLTCDPTAIALTVAAAQRR